jgi:murein DD-endopeptidase MepM/ murein hydrolase activator NlpD
MEDLFPGLVGTWKTINLEELYTEQKNLNMFDVDDQCKLLNQAVNSEDKIFTYGGFGEDRSNLWNGFSYPSPVIHLGVDFNNLPVGQPVASQSNGIVVDSWMHNIDFDGWGGRVVIRDENGLYWMYGHLDRSILGLDEHVKKGDIVGKIGNSNENGGWFPHLHLQVMTDEFVGQNPDWAKIDGYYTSIPRGVLDPLGVLARPITPGNFCVEK